MYIKMRNYQSFFYLCLSRGGDSMVSLCGRHLTWGSLCLCSVRVWAALWLQREQTWLQITVFSSSTHSITSEIDSPLPTLTSTFFSSNIHIVIFVPLCSLLYLLIISVYLFLSLLFSFFSPLSHVFHAPPLAPPSSLQEPQTTVIHNPVDGTKVYAIQAALTFTLLILAILLLLFSFVLFILHQCGRTIGMGLLVSVGLMLHCW